MPQIHNKINLKTDLFILYFLWPIIIAPKEIQFVGIAIILVDLLRRHKLYFDCLSYFLIAFMSIYLFSIVYNLISHSYEFGRILATINTFSIWLFAFVFYLIFKSIHVDFNEIKKITFINYCILIILWIFSLIIFTITNLRDFIIFNRELYYTEWFGNMPVIRFVGFMDYPNLIIMFFMFFYPLFFTYVKKFKSKTLKVLLVILGLFPILSTFSRSGYVIVLTYLLIICIYSLYKKMNRNFFIALTFFTFPIIILLLFFTNIYTEIISIFHELLNAREGSNDSRIYLMMESIRLTFVESPIIGMGIKVTSIIGYPLGSHSTYVGFYYKMGILGFILGTSILLMITLKMAFTRTNLDKTILKFSLLLMPLLFVVEDMDGANWMLVIYFLLVAMILNKTATISKESYM